MEKVIWKQPLSVTSEGQAIALPEGAEILFVAQQDQVPTFWYLHSNPYPEKTELRFFRVYGTGYPIPMKSRYVGSAICGVFVWHVFEELK